MEDKKLYTLTIYSENQLGMLNRVTGIFLRRHIDMESMNVSKSEIDDVFRIVIVTYTTPYWIDHLVKQIEKQVEIIKVFYHTDEQIVFLENSLFKMPTTSLYGEENSIKKLIEQHNVTIVSVYEDFCVLSKTGTRESIECLYEALKPFGILQFAGSARISVSKEIMEVSKFLEQ